MPESRILLIENPASLSIDLGRIKIVRQNQPDAFILPADIAVLCLHHHTINLTVAVLRTLAEAGTAVLVTDEQHHPVGLQLPLVANQSLPQRLNQQIRFQQTEKPGDVWQLLIQSRLRTQANNLRYLKLNGALYLERLTNKLQPGDPVNIEAQAAKHYWKHFFNADFRRKKQGAMDGINSRLNFGYAVLRAMIARQLVMSGLNPALGIGHHGQQNPFNLADDFIEPYRFVVERHVRQLDIKSDDFTSKDKPALLAFIEASVLIDGQDHRLAQGIAKSINSFCRYLDTDKEILQLPEDAGAGE